MDRGGVISYMMNVSQAAYLTGEGQMALRRNVLYVF